MYNTSKRIFDEKRASLIGNAYLERRIGRGKDCMTVLLKENDSANAADKLPDEQVLGQMSLIILAGMDTTAGALARMFYLLGRPENAAVQERLRQEILDAKSRHAQTFGPDDTELTYEELFELPYLDAICRETFRLYPPVTIQPKTCIKETALTLAQPLRLDDGRYVKTIPVAKNQNLFVGIATSNRDRSIWGEDADEWKPERWLSGDSSPPSAHDKENGAGSKVPLVKHVAQAKLAGIYSGMLTFLGGGRSCIGFKFSQLEMKVVTAVLVERFKFELSEQEIAWKLSAILVPVVKGRESGAPSLPLRVTPLTRREQV